MAHKLLILPTHQMFQQLKIRLAIRMAAIQLTAPTLLQAIKLQAIQPQAIPQSQATRPQIRTQLSQLMVQIPLTLLLKQSKLEKFKDTKGLKNLFLTKALMQLINFCTPSGDFS